MPLGGFHPKALIVEEAMLTIDPNNSYMMPANFGPRPTNEKSSGWYQDVTLMIVTYLTDREKLAAYIPAPYQVSAEPLVTIIYACNKNIDWLAGRGYNMFGVNASVVFKGEEGPLEGNLTLAVWENLTDPILTGRELQGIPKIYGDIPDPEITEGVWRTDVSLYGTKFVDLSIKNLSVVSPALLKMGQQALAGKDHPLGWRYLPNVNGYGTTINEATTFPAENNFNEGWIGAGNVEWNAVTWEQNPTQCHIVNTLAELPVLEHRQSLVLKGSTNLIVPDRLPRVIR